MGRPQKYPLNPADNILLATHESLRMRGYCGLTVMLVVDVEGPLDPAEMAKAVRRLGREYPALSARIRISPLRRQAHWQIDSAADFESAVEYEHHVVEEDDNSLAAADALLRDCLDTSLDPTHGPQVRIVHVQTGPDRHRLGLRWPHHLMDLEGGHHLLGVLHAFLSGDSPTLNADPRAVAPPPYNRSFPAAFLRGWQGRWHHAQYCMHEQPRLVGKPEDQRKICHVKARQYDAAFVRRFEESAKQRSAKGPLLYTRALMVAMAQTYFEMATERGRLRDHLMFSQSLPLPRPESRPGLHGNYVILPWIALRTSDIPDWSTCDASALSQLKDYTHGGRTEATWQMFRATQSWPFALARAIVTHRIPRGAAGFTSYRFDNSVTRLGAARISNLSCVGPMNCHPGWILSNTRYGDTMTLSITYFQDYVDPPSVTEFLDRLEQKMCDRVN